MVRIFLKIAYSLVRKAAPGFTLVELMVATLILVAVLVGLLASYVACLDLTDLAKNTSTAINIAQSKIEDIKNDTYVQIKADYNNVPFNVTGLTGKGVSYVDDTNPDLLEVTVTVCWRQKNGRIIGEDTNLNGQLDAGEDKDSDGQIDSIVTLVTMIAKR